MRRLAPRGWTKPLKITTIWSRDKSHVDDLCRCKCDRATTSLKRGWIKPRYMWQYSLFGPPDLFHCLPSYVAVPHQAFHCWQDDHTTLTTFLTVNSTDVRVLLWCRTSVLCSIEHEYTAEYDSYVTVYHIVHTKQCFVLESGKKQSCKQFAAHKIGNALDRKLLGGGHACGIHVMHGRSCMTIL